MTLTMTPPPPPPSSSANAKGEDAAAEIAQPLQYLKKCRYCNHEHWDDFDLKSHEEMHKEYCEEKEIKRQNAREYEMMLMRRFNLKKELSSLQRSFAANELNIKNYETEEDTKEFASEVRERVWENRARKNERRSDTSFVDEHLDLGYYVLTRRERELAEAALSDTALVMEDNFRRLKKLSALDAQNVAL
jgi:predicted ATPase with chaperone activity